MTLGELVSILPKEIGLLKAMEVEVRINGQQIRHINLFSDYETNKAVINLMVEEESTVKQVSHN